MSRVFFIQYEVRPAPESEEFAQTGGAYANCFIRAPSEVAAMEAAQRNFHESGWTVVSIEDGPLTAQRDYYASDQEWLGYFDQAQREGACYVFYLWPPEAQAGEILH